MTLFFSKTGQKETRRWRQEIRQRNLFSLLFEERQAPRAASAVVHASPSSWPSFSSSSLTHHDSLELLVVDGAGTVLVDLFHHLVERQQNLFQHLRVDRTFSLLVENSESLSDFLL